MITTLPIVPANFKKLRVGDQILFRLFKEWQGSLIHRAINHKTIRKLDLTPSGNAFLWTEDPEYHFHEAHFVPKEKTDYPFANQMGNEINKYQSHIYRYSQGYYAFLFATLCTKDEKEGYKTAREFCNRLEVREETEACNKAFLESHGVTDLDSLVAKINAIRPQ